MKKFNSFLFSAIILVTLSLQSEGQLFDAQPNPAKNWQNESIEQDSVYGTGSDKALELLKGRKHVTVIVAVEDGGVQVNHPGLKPNIWTNTKEIPANKIDDDHNGYIDDIHGWDFIGGKDSDVRQDNLEMTRLYRDLGKKYASMSSMQVSKENLPEYNTYLKVKNDYETKKIQTQFIYNNFKGFLDTLAIVKTAMGKNDFTQQDVEAYTPLDSGLAKARRKCIKNFKRFSFFLKNASADTLINLIQPGLNQLYTQLNYQLNVDFDPRFIVGDNYADASEKYYGNNDVIGPTDEHGTHVSGIIAGVRTGKPGAQEGIADDVKIMVIRAVPDGDERDKDVANGIRYAVDNGAKIINMSFGKGYSYNKKAVDAAVKYAEEHDVLIIHAAGNDHNDNDTVQDYPNRRYYGTHKEAKNWIEVGASDSKGKPGSFSNYGKKTVDLFAPGVKIYSTIPDSSYAYFSGTSMAAPSVSGVAAIIREYFPTLTAKQVKKILIKSVTKINFSVPMPGDENTIVMYKELCISGGIINAQKAVQLALKKAGN